MRPDKEPDRRHPLGQLDWLRHHRRAEDDTVEFLGDAGDSGSTRQLPAVPPARRHRGRTAAVIAGAGVGLAALLFGGLAAAGVPPVRGLFTDPGSRSASESTRTAGSGHVAASTHAAAPTNDSHSAGRARAAQEGAPAGASSAPAAPSGPPKPPAAGRRAAAPPAAPARRPGGPNPPPAAHPKPPSP